MILFYSEGFEKWYLLCRNFIQRLREKFREGFGNSIFDLKSNFILDIATTHAFFEL